MKTINEQNAYDNAQIYNAEQINNNLFDNPLKFFCDKKIAERPELDNFFQVVRYIVNNDILKIRFAGNNYRYQELVDTVEGYILGKQDCEIKGLDDGYKSIIKCIVKVATRFTLVIENDIEQLRINANQNLIAQIHELGLSIRYSNEVKTYERYVEAKSIGEEILKEFGIYINCATQYGNFFQFNNIYIEKVSEVPFIAEEIKFRVSNNIIPNLIKPLYGDSPECGLREIMQNAFDATKEFKKTVEDNKLDIDWDKIKVELQVTKDEKETKIRVRDYGIGMNEDVLLKKFFVVGESSKKNSNLDLVGQFGIGALAAFLLGEEIEVKTKHFEENMLYHFKYHLEKTGNISISKVQDDGFYHGTEITIKLNEKLRDLKNIDLNKKLKVDEWYVLSDFIIDYIDDSGKKKDILTLKGEDYTWENLIQEEGLIANYLDKDKSGKYNNCSQVIYNGLVVPQTYEVKCNYIKKKPYLDITSYDKSIKLNLERSKIESGLDRIINSLENKFIDVGLTNLESDKSRLVSDKNEIIQFEYNDEYLCRVPLFFCQDGFGVYSKKNIEKLIKDNKYKNLIKVYGYYGYPLMTLDKLNSDAIYIFVGKSLEKKDIADIVESGYHNQVFVADTFIKRYFFNATSQYNGFRRSLMDKIYEYYGKKKIEGNANIFWMRHNADKEYLFGDIIEESLAISIGDFKYESKLDNLLDLSKELVIEIKPLAWAYDAIDTRDIDKGYVGIK